MAFRDGSFYIWGSIGLNGELVRELYRYDIETKVWSVTEVSGEGPKYIAGGGMCTYKESLYIINGYDEVSELFTSRIYRLNLDGEDKQFEFVGSTDENSPKAAFGFACRENMVYLFAGQHANGYTNRLMTIDLDRPESSNTVLSSSITVPTARYGHGMTVYDEKLYIFGGVDKYGNK
jgi:N-acetylneuraminic acid mutarotase